MDPKNGIVVNIQFLGNQQNSAEAITILENGNFILPCNSAQCMITTTRDILSQSPYLKRKLVNEWKEDQRIQILVANEKLLNAFTTVILYLHLKCISCRNASSDQMRHFLNLHNGIDLEMCIVCNLLELENIKKRIEETVSHRIGIDNFFSICHYASTYHSPFLLQCCYNWIKKQDIRMERKESKMEDGVVYYNPVKHTIVIDSLSICNDVFDALILNDLSSRLHWFCPSYISSGGRPCQIDLLSEEQLRKRGRKPDQYGFKGTIRCFIDRERDAEHLDGRCAYHMYREDTFEYILSAICLPHSNHIAFFDSKIVNLDNVEDYLYSEHYLGVLKGNDLGSEFIVYDNGVNPDRIPSSMFEEIERREVATITYKYNYNGRKPNSMRVQLPANMEYKEYYEDAVKGKGEKSISFLSSPSILVTRKPVWSYESGGWALKFNGRVKKPSKRNFQLVFTEDQEDPNAQVLLCFGKVTSRRFSIDYAAPLSSIQAFGIVLTSFVKKRLAA